MVGTLFALDRVEPVPAEKPAPADVQKVFDDFFSADVKKALAGANPAEEGALAERIFEEAQKHRDHPDFFALALDYVVRLSSVATGKQSLAYSALQTQKSLGLRPTRACLEKMMVLGPRVFQELGRAAGEAWLQNTWAKDALELARLQVAALQSDQGWQTLAALKAVADKAKITLPVEVAQNLEGLEFLKGQEQAINKYQEEADKPGEHPQAQIHLAIIRLVRDKDLESAAKLLKASGVPEATELADSLGLGRKPPLNANELLRFATAAAALAQKTEGAYFQLVLWEESQGKITQVLAQKGLADADRLRAEMLHDRIDKPCREALAKLPPLVQQQLADIQGQAKDVQAFFGLPLSERKSIVYVSEHSGRMADIIMYVKHEMKRSIQLLKPTQSFYVVFGRRESLLEIPGHKLVLATEENKQRAFEFIDGIVPLGVTDPSEAIKKAFEQRPELIYFLSDGQFDQGIVSLIQRLNSGKKVTVNTICFAMDSTDKGKAIMQKIAQQNNGEYKFLSEEDLQNR
jgi:hypothetical protein